MVLQEGFQSRIPPLEMINEVAYEQVPGEGVCGQLLAPHLGQP